MKSFTKKEMAVIVEYTRKFGKSFLGDVSFDSIKDSKKWIKYIIDNDLTDIAITYVGNTDHDNGWFLLCIA